MRSHEYTQGKRAGIKWAISWLHTWANEMNDPKAKAILNTAAFNMGVENRADSQRDPSKNPVPPEEMEAAFRACAAVICNAHCDWSDPSCACRMAVKQALEAAAMVRSTLTQEQR